jgi:endonuclease/exonuclease/phosphatase family metal-dependent hydrolase
MFLSGGGLNQLAVDPQAPGAAPAYAPGATPGSPVVQPTTTGAAAPPLGDGPIIRIASFNIEVFGKSKADNPPVIRTLAEIVRQFDLVAIQEIRTQDDYHLSNFVKLVNSTGRHYDFVVGPRVGNTKSTEQFAYLYDASKIMVDPTSVYTVGDPDNLLHREPHVASFMTRGVPSEEAFTFILVNVHTDPDVVPAELEALAEVYRVVRRASRGEDDVIMLGDFNADDRQIAKSSRLGQIPGVTPLVAGAFSNARQNKLYDNVLIHGPSTTEYVGRSGVFNVMQQVNLSLAEAEQVSDHFPVWAEFSAYERDYTGRIASRRTSAR